MSWWYESWTWAEKPHFSLTRTVEPGLLVSVAEAKAHCRIDQDVEDTQIARWIRAATHVAESKLRRALITQTWQLTLDRWPLWPRNVSFPWHRYVELPRPPLQSVTSIQYLDPNGNLQTWSSANYVVDSSSSPGRITPQFGLYFPPVRFLINAITITYVAGYGATMDTVPDNLVQWVLLAVQMQYQNRSLTMDAALAKSDFAESLLQSESVGDLIL